MRIASWTLAGPGTAPIIGDALRSSMPITDDRIVIWTGPPEYAPDPDGQSAWIVHEEACKIDPWLMWYTWPWCDNFAAARNQALAYVADLGAVWGAMLDTDERIICPDHAVFRAWLGSLLEHVQVVLVHHMDGSHTRERFFRMPARYRFVGRTHEMFPCPSTEQAIAPRELIQWSELPKTREQLRAKFERDVRMLREELPEQTLIRDFSGKPLGVVVSKWTDHDAGRKPNGAALYYLGVSLQSLAIYDREDGNEDAARAKFEEAIDCYRRHRALDTAGAPAWHEGTAWSCYRAAECYLALGAPDRAIDCAVAGMVLDAGIAELPWIAAVASLQVGRLEQARCWGEMAKVHKLGSEAERRRVGFRLPRGLTTGPDEILDAVRKIGVAT